MSNIHNYNLGSQNPVLRMLLGAQDLRIPATDGSETIVTCHEFFFGSVDKAFHGLKTDVCSTPETPVTIYELVQCGAKLCSMFGSLGARDISKLCLTQSQITRFVAVHRGWLSPHCSHFFLFQSNGELLTTMVVRDENDLAAAVLRPLRSTDIFYSGDPNNSAIRIVVPQM